MRALLTMHEEVGSNGRGAGKNTEKTKAEGSSSGRAEERKISGGSAITEDKTACQTKLAQNPPEGGEDPGEFNCGGG